MYDLNLTTHQVRGRAQRRLNARNIDMLNAEQIAALTKRVREVETLPDMSAFFDGIC